MPQRPLARPSPSPAPTAPDPPALANSPSGSKALPLPHEQDESVGHVASAPDPVIEQASKDLEAGLVDTDMRATPGLDAARRRRLVPTPTPERSRNADPRPRRPQR